MSEQYETLTGNQGLNEHEVQKVLARTEQGNENIRFLNRKNEEKWGFCNFQSVQKR